VDVAPKEADRQPVQAEESARVSQDHLDSFQLADPLADPLAGGAAVQQETEAAASADEGGIPPGFDAAAKAKQLHDAFDGWGTDERKVLDILYTGRTDLTKAIETAYNGRYSPPLVTELRDELSGGDLQKALKLLQRGGLTLADKIREAARGWGTDEDKIFNAFDRASATELEVVRKDAKIKALLRDELSGADWKLAQAYLQGQGALAGKLRRAVDGWGTDEATIWRELEGATHEEKQFVLKQPALLNHIRSDLDSADWLRCQRMLNGTLTNVDRIEVALAGWGTDEQGVATALADLTAEEYARLPGDIDSRLEGELSGEDLAKAQESLHQKRLKFDADYRKAYVERQKASMGEDAMAHEGASALVAGEGQSHSAVGRLMAACAGAGTDDTTVWEVLSGLTQAERDFISAHNPDGVLDTLRGDLSAGDYDRAMTALSGGSGRAASAVMREAVAGWGTDEKLLYDALVRVSREGGGAEVLADAEIMEAVRGDITSRQYSIFTAVLRDGTFTGRQRLHWATSGAGTDEDLIFELCTAYDKEWYSNGAIAPDVDELLQAELDNRDYWKAKDLVRGEPGSEEERLARAKEELERERGSTVSAGIMDVFSTSGENADDAWREYQSSFNQAHADGEVTADEVDQLRQDERFSQRMTAEYRETKASVAQWATQIAVAIVGIAATILTAGTAGPFVAALAASLGGKVAVAAEAMVLAAALKVGMNRAIQGEGYDVGSAQALVDACSASIEVGLNIVGGQLATKMVEGLGKTAVGQSVGPTLEKVFGGAGRRILSAGLEGAIDGGMGGLGEGAFLALANEDAWKGDSEDLLGHLGSSMVTNGGMSALGGFLAGAGFKSIGESFGSKVRSQMGTTGDAAGDLGGELGEAGGKNAAKMGGQLDDTASATIADELRTILDSSIGDASGPMTGAQFNKMMDDLADFAKKYDILISTKLDTVGVFPKGLNEIQLAGFGKMDDLAANVNFAKRHELAHVFHTLQARATILDGVKAGRLSVEQANVFIEALETGANYRQFEKAVTGASSASHLTSGSKDVALYASKLDALIGNTRLGLHNGGMSFPNGRSFQDVYATFLSKAPAVVGTSMKDLAIRMPPIMFASLYVANVDPTAYGLNPVDWGMEANAGGGKIGFRDFINRLVTDKR